MERRLEVGEHLLSEKLATIGLTIAEYHQAYYLLEQRIPEGLYELNKRAESRMERFKEGGVLTTKEQFQDPVTQLYSPEREALHEAIIESIVAPFQSSEQPQFKVFAGPPGAGKSTAMDREINSEKYLLTDPMLIQKKLNPYLDEKDYSQILRTKDESFNMAEKLIDRAFEKKVNIASESTLQNLPWITKSLNQALSSGYNAEIVFVHKSLQLCFRDAIEGRMRPISLNYLFKSLQGYSHLLILDARPGVKVNVVRKRNNFESSVIYEDVDGTLYDNKEYKQLLREICPIKNLATY